MTGTLTGILALSLTEELHVVEAGSGRPADPRIWVGAGRSVPDAGVLASGATHVVLTAATGTSGTVDQLLGRVLALRRAGALAADAHTQRLLASGTGPFGATSGSIGAGMRLRVYLADSPPGLRAAVQDGLRPWLPVLLALTANSPYWLGADTGFACYGHVRRRPGADVAPDPTATNITATGPTATYVEVRVADVVPDAADVGTFVALVRALAARCRQEYRAGLPGPGCGPETSRRVLRAATWWAARRGLEDRLVQPLHGQLAPAADVLQALLRHAQPGLEETGDGDRARVGVTRVLRDGNGAARQRRAYVRAGWPGVVDLVRVDPAATSVAPTTGDGNGWVDCACGARHWGRLGAAGLLVVRTAAGGPQVLLQLRAAWTHQGGTWGLPGGARDSHEDVRQAALREAHEEAGIDPAALQVVGEVVVDHGSWSYTYVLAEVRGPVRARVANLESDAVEWVPLEDVPNHRLHPALAAAWPGLADRLGRRP
jgi:8-oxo-dGTP diphosphatase